MSPGTGSWPTPCFPVPIAVVLVVAGGAGAAAFSSSSLEQRITGWVSLGGQSIEPLGQGIGSTGAAAERIETQRYESGGTVVLSDQAVAKRYQADNHYVKTLIELGPVGLWLLVWILAAATRQSHQSTRLALEGTDRGLASGIAAATLAAVGAATVATYWEIFPSDLLFWLFLGVLPSLGHRPSPTARSSELDPPPSSMPTGLGDRSRLARPS